MNSELQQAFAQVAEALSTGKGKMEDLTSLVKASKSFVKQGKFYRELLPEAPEYVNGTLVNIFRLSDQKTNRQGEAVERAPRQPRKAKAVATSTKRSV